MQSKVAIIFMNGIGNFIFLTSIVKILRQWKYESIDLCTDPAFLNNPGLMELSEGLFSEIRTSCIMSDYKHIFFCGWSKPMWLSSHPLSRGYLGHVTRTTNFLKCGIHEVEVYLNMIGANWSDFDGYVLEPTSDPILDLPHPIIALANPDPNRSQQAQYKGWNKFPQLSEALDQLGFSVVLLGTASELNGCKGLDLTGQLTLKQSAKVLSQCDLLVSPSTCLSLVADAVRTPIIRLEGPILGSKDHPLLSSYRVVRKFISCAPCFQTNALRFCKDNLCMKSIEVSDVILAVLDFLKDASKKKQEVRYSMPEYNSADCAPLECNGKVAYLFPCYGRFDLLMKCLESFKDSHPQEGTMLLLDDASPDRRVWKYLKGFEVDGLNKFIYRTVPEEKRSLLRTYLKTPSTHAYNYLIEKLLKLVEEGHKFDYVSIIDPDASFKPNWIRIVINTYEEAVRDHSNIGLMSGFNHTEHPIYDDLESSLVYESSAGRYRLRRGANLHYMMSMDFLRKVHGFYALQTEAPSSDISQNKKLTELGYKTLVTVPSVIQQIGAFGSSYVRYKSNEVALDY